MMSETDFWIRLEHRVCQELAGFEDDHLRFLWCDGFLPEQTDFEAPRPCIRGRAWVYGYKEGRWTFTLFVGQARSQDEVDWSTLLPPDNMTGWLTPDLKAKTLTMDPLSAYPE